MEDDTYALDGVPVDEFTLPAAWSGAAGPYDEAGHLLVPLMPGFTLGTYGRTGLHMHLPQGPPGALSPDE